MVQIPWGVKAVWCVLTPKNIKHDSIIHKIACCAMYFKPGSTRKTLLLDHISDAYNVLSSKFGRGLQFILAGDTNELKLDPIHNLSPNFRQIVQDWTRLNPPALLDPVITTMANFYQKPECLEPLDADPDKNGVKSDHRIVIVKPINTINNRCGRTTRKIKVRPFPQSGLGKMKTWFMVQIWENVESAHEKASILESFFLRKRPKLKVMINPG